jgi:O-antigen ligase
VKKNLSAGLRLELWKDAIYTFRESPLLGVGLEARTLYRIKHKQDRKISVPEVFYDTHAHNQFLEALSVRGLIGLSALALLFLWPLWVFLKRLKLAKKMEADSKMKQEAVCQLGICHILLVVGYCATQAFLEHNSGIVFYSVMLVVFFAMSSNLLNKERS